MKTCTKCCTEKPLDQFYRESRKGGVYVKPTCKACEKAYARFYRLTHRPQCREFKRNWRAKNPAPKRGFKWRNTNVYELSQDGTHLRIITKNGDVFLIDHEDEALARQHCWQSRQGYARAFGGVLHRLILNAQPGQHVDHANRDRADNRRANLRICTPQQNAFNRVHPSKKYPYKGVGKNQGGVIQARITIDGKMTMLGSYKTLEDAARAYDAAAKIHFGQFARLNFPE